MALICCPECGKQVSDQAVSCPFCGYPLASISRPGHEPLQASSMSDQELQTPGDTPPASPQQVEIVDVRLPKARQRARKILFGVGGVAVIAAVVVLVALRISHMQEAAEYSGRMRSVVNLMLTGAVRAEKAGNLIREVWYNSIFEEKDPATDPLLRQEAGEDLTELSDWWTKFQELDEHDRIKMSGTARKKRRPRRRRSKPKS